MTKQQNEFKIRLKELEDSLLSRLSSAGANVLEDTALVENLETTKRTAGEIEKKVAEALITEKKINEAREHYRPAAARASLLYFILNDLEKINPLYQFSLKVCVYSSPVDHPALPVSPQSPWVWSCGYTYMYQLLLVESSLNCTWIVEGLGRRVD